MSGEGGWGNEREEGEGEGGRFNTGPTHVIAI